MDNAEQHQNVSHIQRRVAVKAVARRDAADRDRRIDTGVVHAVIDGTGILVIAVAGLHTIHRSAQTRAVAAENITDG